MWLLEVYDPNLNRLEQADGLVCYTLYLVAYESQRTTMQDFLPIKTYTKADVAYAQLRRHILDGSLPPGEVLNQEQVATALRVSVTPLREALRHLEGEGLVVISGNRVTIAPLSNKEISELRYVRNSLEVLAIRLATSKITPEQQNTLLALADISPTLSPIEWRRAHTAFHSKIWEIADNSVLTDTLERLTARIERYRRLVANPELNAKMVAVPHRALAEAITPDDEDAAVEALLQHMQPILTVDSE